MGVGLSVRGVYIKISSKTCRIKSAISALTEHFTTIKTSRTFVISHRSYQKVALFNEIIM